MRIILSLFTFLLTPVSIFAQQNSEKPAVTLERIDDIVAKAPDLDTFLADEHLTTEYFNSLQEYFGEESFNRNQFDVILNQLREVKEKVPGLKERLWEAKPNTGETFAVQGALKTRGRDLSNDNWVAYKKKKAQELETLAKPLLDLSPEERKKEIDQLNDEVGERIKSLHESADYKTAPRVKRGELDSDLFKKLGQEANENPKTRQVAAYFAQQVLKNEMVEDHFSTTDADLVLDTLENIQKNPTQYLEKDTKLNTVLMRAVRDSLPDANRLQEHSNIFPIRYIKTNRGKSIPAGTSDGKFIFKPVPRRLHGIWKGAPLGECVGGRCGYDHALTPERWATVALKDSQLHYVEKAGSYLGFVEAVPGKVGDETYATVGFGAPQLKNKIVVKDPTTGKLVQSSLYSEWLTQAEAKKPKAWKGFIVSNSDAINNAGVLNTVRSSASFRLGMAVNESGTKHFEHIDPMAADLIKAGHGNSYAGHYGGNMILDATTRGARDAKTLTLLAPVSDSQMENPEFVKAMLLGKDPQRAFSAFKFIASKEIPQDLDVPLAEYTRKTFHGSDDTITRNVIATLGGRKTIPAEVLNALAEEAGRLDSRFRNEALDYALSFDPESKNPQMRASLLKRIHAEMSQLDLKHPSQGVEKLPTLYRIANDSKGTEGGKIVLDTLEKEYPNFDFKRVYIQTQLDPSEKEWVRSYLTLHPQALTKESLMNVPVEKITGDKINDTVLTQLKVIDGAFRQAPSREDKIRILRALGAFSNSKINGGELEREYGRRFKEIVESLGPLNRQDLEVIAKATDKVSLRWGDSDAPKNLTKAMLSQDKTTSEVATQIAVRVYEGYDKYENTAANVMKINQLVKEKKYDFLFSEAGFVPRYKIDKRAEVAALAWYLEHVELSDQELPDELWKLLQSENETTRAFGFRFLDRLSRSTTMAANESKWINYANQDEKVAEYVINGLSKVEDHKQHPASYWALLEKTRTKKFKGEKIDWSRRKTSEYKNHLQNQQNVFKQLKKHYTTTPAVRKTVGLSFYLQCAKNFARLKKP